MQLDIELVLLGVPKGASQGSRVIRDVPSLKLNCLPAHVPEQVELRVNDLEPHDKVFAQDLELPEGCSLNMPEDLQILHMSEIEIVREPELEEGDALPTGDAPAAEGDTPPEGK